jgi:transcriptional regulator with XRE-family HTH domain
MARAALEWGVRDLAKAAEIAPNTVMRFETGRNAPNTITLKAMKQAFEAAGVRFIAEGEESLRGGPGVRLKASAEEQQSVEESAASLLAREEGLRASKRKGKV